MGKPSSINNDEIRGASPALTGGAPWRNALAVLGGFLGLAGALVALHWPLLDLPYYWDEAGYYIPAALDFYRHGLLIPQSTMPTGHTPGIIVYLAVAWKVCGFSPLVTRTAMLMIAAATLAALYQLARRIASREVALWTTLLLALSPLFFAQSSLVHLDLPAALFTTLAILFLLDGRMALFGLAASLAVLCKETAVILLPIAWAFAWFRRRERRPAACCWLASPLVPLAAWTLYYHHATGFLTGNRQYLEYNLYSTLAPARLLATLLRRLDQVFVGGFNWVLVAGAWLGRRRERKIGKDGPHEPTAMARALHGDFEFLAIGLLVVYVAMLTVVGGAVLARYLLPAIPAFYLLLVRAIGELRQPAARGILLATTALFVAAWFINPPYPFPYEDNLAYADFIRLHQQAARFLAAQPGRPRILTAWPATDELAHPDLGYIREPLRVEAMRGFASRDFRSVAPDSFDLLYLYSRQWQPRENLLSSFPCCQGLIERAFRYEPPAPESALIAQFDLRLLASFTRRGQWVRIYARPRDVLHWRRGDMRSPGYSSSASPLTCPEACANVSERGGSGSPLEAAHIPADRLR